MLRKFCVTLNAAAVLAVCVYLVESEISGGPALWAGAGMCLLMILNSLIALLGKELGTYLELKLKWSNLRRQAEMDKVREYYRKEDARLRSSISQS